MAFIHDHKVVHRDLKLENCFINDNLDLYLGDFGIAKNVEKVSSQTSVGTTETMAPEVIQKQSYGVSADIWSLGCVWYELMTGKKAFDDDVQYIVMQKILKAEFIKPNSTKYPKFERNLLKMLQIKSDLRPSAKDLLVEFD